MSSDTFRLKVLSVEGSAVRLEVWPTGAITPDSMVLTRSFVLGVLDEIGALGLAGKTTNEAWVSEHVGEYVVRTEVEKAVGIPRGSGAENYGLSDELLATHVTLAAELASAELAAHFRKVTTHSTALWDVWWKDPKRPAPPNVKAIGPLFPGDAAFPVQVAALVPPLVAGLACRPAGKGKLEIVGEEASLTITVAPRKLPVIGMRLIPQLSLRCPRVEALVAGEGAKAKKPAPLPLFEGVLHLHPSRAHAGVEPAQIAADIAAVLVKNQSEIAALLTLRGLLDEIELYAAANVPAKIKKQFVSHAQGPGLKLQDLELLSVDDFFFVRVPVLLAAVSREAAVAALALASSQWKRQPAALTELFARLGAA